MDSAYVSLADGGGVHMMEIDQPLERSDVPCNSICQSPERYVKGNKSDTEGQKLRLSHMWNPGQTNS